MRRRAFVRAAAAAVAAGVAGCNAGGPGDGPDDGETTDGTTTTGGGPGTGDGTAPGGPRLVDHTFRITENTPGTEVNEASVSFAPAEDDVVVTGTIYGPNTCYTARLADLAYDTRENVLTVKVAAESDTPDDETVACGQAFVEVDYETTATFAGGLPDRVVVEHDVGAGFETVAEATRDD